MSMYSLRSGSNIRKTAWISLRCRGDRPCCGGFEELVMVESNGERGNGDSRGFRRAVERGVGDMIALIVGDSQSIDLSLIVLQQVAVDKVF